MSAPQPSNVIPMPRHGLLAMDLIASGGGPMKFVMESLERIYREGRRWSIEELHAALDLSREPSMMLEMELVTAYYHKLPNTRLFPHSVMRLLQSWTEVCDKARTASKPRGTMKDPAEINQRKMQTRMAFLRARSFNEDDVVWREDVQAMADRKEFGELRNRLKGRT